MVEESLVISPLPPPPSTWQLPVLYGCDPVTKGSLLSQGQRELWHRGEHRNDLQLSEPSADGALNSACFLGGGAVLLFIKVNEAEILQNPAIYC